MKKLILFVMLFILVIFTSITKNSTKKIETKIYNISENLKVLKNKKEMTLLEFNYLSSPQKLMEYQSMYFEKELKEIDIENLNLIYLKGSKLNIKKLIDNKKEDE